ncbi:hypothetical protein COCC4DRAFT_22906 [Bipolaris maydis ATCC 48331]|uniref:Zn(2)-C6 fungal-type domain-containing protein n=1 Tax=Cochliobolus heterostrophus (strain C4 / ATCC 48331 / race T) TaxID=665024 RepID=N4WYV3_COCH4|nr:uncharacterized protein COCC4DRAFT_22906 [Bipolaris maydis ATCC 48331]KAH7560154.1 hypothetical protein BM1_03788 [Bipolaris maydis]ENI05879.1 hypothetical protein COCC4DRAFT_22906 [Bipolaris maydis ATCC 48331]KAJ5022757.1 hypothetical protein J3E73DRAFT_196813 [Bipolaris maydis]KAJ5064564.1 hypothetical protein J3E74DRAFT_444855 [Bipolaris maydis]KAJ6193421.1 hypothetical protein J3E72DRAFT_272649 [Bipolaris maydis]
MPKEETLPTRKKMRKGTHSCFECRRRKIRCIFQPENPDVCSECFARGSRCIDQEHANPDVIVDHRKNLRERVSRLEALVDSLLEEKTVKSESRSQSIADTSSPKAPNVYNKDTLPPTPLSSESPSNPLKLTHNQRAASKQGHHIPILSVFEDAINNDAEAHAKALSDPLQQSSTPKPDQAEDERYTVENQHDEDIVDSNPFVNSAKRERTKQALIAVLPPFDQLTKILHTNSDWWDVWRRKCMRSYGTEQTLSQFAAQALATGNVGAIATVVLSVGICLQDTEQVSRYFEAVDRWFLCDDEYAASLEGLECFVMKSKWYADVGQPRRAWIAYRKGLMYAQLMGLHRKRTASVAHESLWWALYHGDRFLSLLLGLPYGINDAHCDLTMFDMGESKYMHPMVCMVRLSQLAGKVIDRNQGVAEQSFAWALQLDQELDDLWKKFDPAWLDYTELLADIGSNSVELRERIMGQIVFHQIRVYLHLPFMLKSASNSRFSYSRTVTLNGSREVLRLYQVLRTGGVTPIYECKAIDFLGFTAAILMLIGMLNGSSAQSATSTSSSKTIEEDVRIIENCIDIFRRASSEKGGNVAAQSAEVLEKIMAKFKGTSSDADDLCNGPSSFVIPYFGTVSIKRGGQPVKGPPSSCRSPATVSSRSPSTSHQLFTPPSGRHSSSTSEIFSQPSKSLNFTPKTSMHTPMGATSVNLDPSPFVSYDGFYNWNNLNADDGSTTGTSVLDSHMHNEGMNGFSLPTNNFSWQNMPMDIDQDWSWFLNDAQTTQGVAPATPAQVVPLDAFNAQGFTGFG